MTGRTRPVGGLVSEGAYSGGGQSILIGESVARYFIWDAKRALDYLVSRPDVDAARLGAVGCSGGGALTTFIGALDPGSKRWRPPASLIPTGCCLRGLTLIPK